MRKLNRLHLIGLLTASIAFALDQASKWALISLVHMQGVPSIEITGFFNLVMVWNYGVSFGMFSEHNQPLVLIALACAICVVLGVWLARAPNRYVAIALGLTIGGAMGNILDRIRYGAVADFFDFYIGNAHWPAFNIADSCIFIGVVVLLIDGMFISGKKDS